jgi:hypothetical protein
MEKHCRGPKTSKHGHIWRVGSGTSMNIWEDHWILNIPTSKVMTIGGQILYVDEFVNPYTSTWDHSLIRGLLLPLDAERIMRIPLSEDLTNDFVACHRNKSHCFTVCSAYYV